jgi:hypothetical protein
VASLPVISQRYDTTEFKGWGSANDMIPWELGAPFPTGSESPRQGRGKWAESEREHPRGGSEVWQVLGLETAVFGSVAILGLTGEFSDVWQGKELEKRKR